MQIEEHTDEDTVVDSHPLANFVGALEIMSWVRKFEPSKPRDSTRGRQSCPHALESEEEEGLNGFFCGGWLVSLTTLLTPQSPLQGHEHDTKDVYGEALGF